MHKLKRLSHALRDFGRHLRGKPLPGNTQITPEHIRRLVAKPDPIILEIGCNDGSNTEWFLEVFDHPRVFCFEPDPRAITRFRRRIGDGNVQLFELALSDGEGEITFHMSGGRESNDHPEGWDLSGSILKPKEHLVEHPWCSFDQQIKVKTTTLDKWRSEHEVKQIDFIWMDVQGAEIDVIRGGRQTLAQTRFLYTEYNNKEIYEGQADLNQLLKALPEFRVLARYPDDILLENFLLSA